MNSKLVVLHNSELTTTSLVIATGTKVQHKNVMELIKTYQSDLMDFGTFAFQTRKSKGRPTEYAILNEPQTTLLITYMKNTEIVRNFKKKLVKEFFRLRKALNDITTRKSNQEWIESRETGKLARKTETDIIKQFVEYAKNQGSQNADKYYANISKMEARALFLIGQKFPNLREVLTSQQLNWIQTADTIATKALKDGMARKMHYKEIYQLAKRNIETLASVLPKSEVPYDEDILLLEGEVDVSA